MIPLFKKGSKLDPGNFRPVSILCSISKIVERIIYEQIDSYLAEHNLLFDFQSGFRKAYSTDTCLLYLTDFIRKEVEQGNYCDMVLIDLQKAFDTVQYDVLLNKLKALGFSPASLQWVRSYLVVDVEGTLSFRLSGELMARKIISKVSQRTKFLARISSLLDSKTLKILADALVQCYLDYACTSWYTGITKGLKDKLQICQNKLIRVILKLHPRSHLLPDHFSSLGWQSGG